MSRFAFLALFAPTFAAACSGGDNSTRRSSRDAGGEMGGSCILRGRGDCTRSEDCCPGLVCLEPSVGPGSCQPGCEVRTDCPPEDLDVQGDYCVVCREPAKPFLGSTTFEKSCAFTLRVSAADECPQ